MVSYLNSKPFEYGLKHTELTQEMEVITANPALCATLFENHTADIALIPVGALHDFSDYKTITDYCIGCDGDVRTVCIFSNEDIQACKRLYLDNHSRTSYLLSKIIMEEHFGLHPEYCQLDINQFEPNLGDAVLMIGDKVFQYENSFRFKYDLGAIWKKWTGLPFVFAVWIARPELDNQTEQNLNMAFRYGIAHLPEIIRVESKANLDLYFYFSHNIQYCMDEEKNKGLNLFMKKSASYINSNTKILG